MRKPFAEWSCNLILLLCVLEKRGDEVKLSIVTLKNNFFSPCHAIDFLWESWLALVSVRNCICRKDKSMVSCIRLRNGDLSRPKQWRLPYKLV